MKKYEDTIQFARMCRIVRQNTRNSPQDSLQDIESSANDFVFHRDIQIIMMRHQKEVERMERVDCSRRMPYMQF